MGKLAKLLDNRAFVSLASIGLVIVCLSVFALAMRWEKARSDAEWKVNHQTWVSCGKPFGQPCDCPKEGCLCGIVKGRSCPNCRPMK